MRRFLRLAVFAAAVVALAVFLAGCGSKDDKSSSDNSSSSSSSAGAVSKSYDNGSPEKGGTYKVGWEQSFGFTNNFDPTGEYLGNAWGIYVNLLMRPLVGYKHQPGAEGNELIGDLAEAVPEATDRGRTYTYKLRDGIKFGPPVNRAVTSKDVAYAMNRLANPKDGGQYSFYYTVIEGWQDVADGKAKTVSGITTPDDKTIVFHLTKPTGDFNLRMSMPATAPIPKEVGDCFEGKPGDYGRNVISTGPYMIKGSDGHVLVVQRPQAVQRLRRRQRQPHRARPQPELRPVDRRVPEELSGRVPVPGQLERGRHLRAGCGRQARR